MGAAMNTGFALAHSFWLARHNLRRLHGAALAHYQDRRAQSIVGFARRHSPFYAALYGAAPTTSWRTLPTIDKAVMMANFTTLNTRQVKLEAALATALAAESSHDFRARVGELTVGLSSGTSGHRGLFLVDELEQARWAGTVVARVAPRIRRHGVRITLFSMSGSNLYQRLQRGWLRFQHFNLATPIDEAVARLNAQPPDLLAGPPSYLHALSERQLAGDLRLRPERLISVAEVLEPHIEKQLGERFACAVHQIYQCTEGLIGVSCKAGRLHLQEDLVAVQTEPLEPAAQSQRVTPIITDLWRQVQPIIRYRLNDILTLSAAESCSCGSGFRTIERIEGRLDDVCRFRARDGSLRPVFPATIRRMVLLASGAVRDYEVIQERDSQLRVRLALACGAAFETVAPLVRNALEAGLREQGIAGADLVIEPGEPQRFTTRKLRRVRRAPSEETI